MSQTFDCKTESAKCWTAFGDFLKVQGSQQLMKIGATLWQNARLDREKEQSLVRIQLCQVLVGFDKSSSDGATKAAMCGALKDDVVDAAQESLAGELINGEVQCSSYGFGPGTRQCDGSVAASATSGGATQRTVSTTTRIVYDPNQKGGGYLGSTVALVAGVGVSTVTLLIVCVVVKSNSIVFCCFPLLTVFP